MHSTSGSTSTGKGSPDPRWRLSIGRHPRDLIRLLVAGGLLAASVLLALVPANPVEIAIFQQLARIPAVSDPVWVALTWCGSWAGITAVTATALYLKRIRLGLLCASAGGVTWGLAKGLHWLLGPRPVPERILPEPTDEVFFPATSVAVVTVLTVVLVPYLGNRVRLAGWPLIALVAAAEVHLGHHLPWGVVSGTLLGWGVGTLFHLLWGAPGHKVSEETVRHELELSGFGPVSVTALTYRLLEPRQFSVNTENGETFRVKVVRRLQRRAGVLYRIRRALAVLDVPEEPRLSSAHHEVEHEAYVTLLAERAGVRTPAIVLASDVKHAPPLLVHRQIDGRRLTQLPDGELDDELLEAIWHQVALLAEAGIAHHDLRAKNILVDAERRPWLLSFTFGQAGAGATRLAQDLAEALVSLAAVAGTDRTVTTAMRALPIDRLEAALVNLRPLALPRRVLAQPATNRYLLAELRETLADRIRCPIPGFRSPVRPATLVGLLLTGAAVYLLLPRLSDMSGVLEELRRAHWGWLAAAVATGILAIPMSALSLLGSSRTPLPFWRTTAVQVAAAFTGRTTPGGAGFFGINLIYIERLGLRRSSAVGITVLNQAGTGAVAVLFSVIGVFVTGSSGVPRNLSIPTGWPVVLAAAGILVLIGVLVASPFGRRRIVQPSREVARELLDTLRHPVRAAQLFGGALGYLLISGFGLVASLAAFHPDFSVAAVLTVFVIGNTIGHLVPSPGGLGAVEAAMIGGLGAVGIAPATSVTAVLVSRLLTYWLPVLPGIAMFRYLQHHEII
ncbi:undecaprenyl-diphosphatase [Halopolyspora algeriensis]|uniref:Undecaprenyl-diphosphatase n=1 Tax=Halopolyspora algeriensis TaxID=1500506 RepID=A0A368VS34_9ACTN|nr:lysylphosphatidylglycerol synthase transmembrane domain-containing protein [Halopolyspora algeriensis]RCW44495.1 undecaprenyl-diphosphatase [Halopolyspora algeriensis]TQM55856.1 undecaprenyl-diphosphatase [Halopolyspora algeriensis]